MNTMPEKTRLFLETNGIRNQIFELELKKDDAYRDRDIESMRIKHVDYLIKNLYAQIEHYDKIKEKLEELEYERYNKCSEIEEKISELNDKLFDIEFNSED